MKKNTNAIATLIVAVIILAVFLVAMIGVKWYYGTNLHATIGNTLATKYFVASAMKKDEELCDGNRKLGDATLSMRAGDRITAARGKIVSESYEMVGLRADEFGGYVLIREGRIAAYIPGRDDFIEEGMRDLIPDFPIQGADELIGKFNSIKAYPELHSWEQTYFDVVLEIERTENGIYGKIWKRLGDSQNAKLDAPKELRDNRRLEHPVGNWIALDTGMFADTGEVRFWQDKIRYDCTEAESKYVENVIKSIIKPKEWNPSRLEGVTIEGLVGRSDPDNVSEQPFLMAIRFGGSEGLVVHRERKMPFMDVSQDSGFSLMDENLKADGICLFAQDELTALYRDENKPPLVRTIEGSDDGGVSIYSDEVRIDDRMSFWLCDGDRVEVLLLIPQGAEQVSVEDFRIRAQKCLYMNRLLNLSDVPYDSGRIEAVSCAADRYANARNKN